MSDIKNPQVGRKFQSYPNNIQEELLLLRQLIFETAAETEAIGQVEETLKWGEPSYLADGGSTIRINWKAASPHQYAMYFHCKTRLVETFRECYRDKFNFEGNRAILFDAGQVIPIAALKHCIAMSLMYHKVKHLPMLGA
ncbi:DUF1801 domain-containing protein [Exilibacterium tricleocarpae]|uniref:DUF1801 domain-containing protein n=1 Tax=Exilibacterium tricleocarpae TaxID=2591008 RepID=A0A545STC3_9GAMM|nr:DUF1801 domain-containing protein [Exilibacterium tricleocarpae]